MLRVVDTIIIVVCRLPIGVYCMLVCVRVLLVFVGGVLVVDCVLLCDGGPCVSLFVVVV